MKIETHLHTGQTSYCALSMPPEIVRLYKEAGFDAIVVTDHYNSRMLNRFKQDTHAHTIDRFLQGYHQLCAQASEQGIAVFLGAEVLLEQYNEEGMPSAEFLLYGTAVEQLLYQNKDLHLLSQAQLFELCNKHDVLMFQAHPFRNYAIRCDTSLMHGIEVYNGNPRHESNNRLAYDLARATGKLMISGSDYHQAGDEGRGGIITQEPIHTYEELINVLKTQNLQIIR